MHWCLERTTTCPKVLLNVARVHRCYHNARHKVAPSNCWYLLNLVESFDSDYHDEA